jgi:hypothetical protein
VLTPKGEDYVRAVVAVIGALNRELADRVDAAQLSAAELVLRAVIADGADVHGPSATARPRD